MSRIIAVARYVERNPVRAGLVERAEDWPWSSATLHVTGRADPLAEVDWLVECTKGWVCTWREYLAEEDESPLGRRLGRHENTGRPLGGRVFLEHIGRLLGRNLIPQKPGPKPKKEN